MFKNEGWSPSILTVFLKTWLSDGDGEEKKTNGCTAFSFVCMHVGQKSEMLVFISVFFSQ